ncbi:MAG: hypothetical protein H0Z28_08040 [Archaeoglobus sp.]|nr:hypothetical protein [Archaeoglobus sp.]
MFLRWLAERFDEPVFEEYAKLLKWKGKKTKKLYTEEEKAITLEKLRKAIDVILSGKWRRYKVNDAFMKLRAIAAIILGASTGLRPFELYRIEDKQIKEGIKKRYFILPEEFTKTPFERLIPINKESHWILNHFMVIWENKKLRKKLQLQSKKMFPKDTITDVIKKRVSGIEVDNLRDFEVDYSMNKLGVPGFLEAIIAGHDTEKYAVRIENYLKGKVTKESIRDDWLKYWDKVEILTKEQKNEVEKLVKSILE